MSNKIPKHAKIVFSGIIFDVYHWEQEMFDWSFATFEAIKRKPWITVLPITKGGKILYIKELQPHMDDYATGIVCWWCEKWENPDLAASRELEEETWYKAEEMIKLSVYDDFWTYKKIEGERHLYLALWCEKTSEQKLDAWEKIDTFEVDKKTFLDIVDNEFNDYEKNFFKENFLKNKIVNKYLN